MRTAWWAQEVRKLVVTPPFWLLAAMFAAAVLLHYPDLLPVGAEPQDSLLGAKRHAMERVLFLLPVTYAGFTFGIRGGLVMLGLAVTAMLPRAVFISSTPRDALLETATVVLVGSLVNLWFEGHLKERRRRQEAVLMLQWTQQELRSRIQLAEKEERQLAAVNAVSNIVSQSLDLHEVLKLAAPKVMEVMATEVFLAYLFDECSRELVLEVSEGVCEEFAAGVARLKVGEGFNGEVQKTGRFLVVEDASHDARLTREVVRQERIRAELIVPLRSKGKVLGTLCVATRRPRQFSDEEVELLSAIGSVIGVAIENALLYQRQRQMAAQLVTSEKSFRGLFENAHDAIWVHDMAGRIIMANRACITLTGYGQEELIGMRVREFLSEEALRKAREVRRRLLRGEVMDQPYEQRIIKKDGREACLWLTTSLIVGDGKPRGFQLIARDVTEQRRMEENLRFYLHQATRAQEEERKRIARELHDDTAQDLVALSRQIEKFMSTSGRLSLRQVKLLEELEGQVDKVLEGVRRFSQDLRPSILDDLGLLPALEWLTSDVTAHFGVEVGMAVVGAERRFSPEVELALFRIAQEALRNVWKHSKALRAWVTVEFADGKTTLTVTDDGSGFEVPERPDDLAKAGKLGLGGMQERARLIGGTLALRSEPGKGTSVVVDVPV